MKNLLLIFLTVLFISGFYSCNKSEDKKTEHVQDQIKDPAAENNYSSKDESALNKEQKKDQRNEIESGQKEESENKFKTRSVKVNFPAGSTQITLDGDINGFGDKISYEFEVSEGQTLYAEVKPEKGEGNVSINQIVDPEGKADGPFSDMMKYKLTKSGSWKLVIGENMMSGEPWSGNYLLTIEIK